ncbi:MAG: hypothetical protein JSV81_04045, partial [Anaerolineales bacterium]
RGRSGQIGGPGLDSDAGIGGIFCEGVNVGSDGLWVLDVLLIAAVGLAMRKLLSPAATQLPMNKQPINNAHNLYIIDQFLLIEID